MVERVGVGLRLDVAGVSAPRRADLVLDEAVVVRELDVGVVADQHAIHPPPDDAVATAIHALVLQVPLEAMPLAERDDAAVDVRRQPRRALLGPLHVGSQLVRPALRAVHRHVDARVLHLQELNLVDVADVALPRVARLPPQADEDFLGAYRVVLRRRRHAIDQANRIDVLENVRRRHRRGGIAEDHIRAAGATVPSAADRYVPWLIGQRHESGRFIRPRRGARIVHDEGDAGRCLGVACRVADDCRHRVRSVGDRRRTPRDRVRRAGVFRSDVRAIHLELHADDTDVVRRSRRQRRRAGDRRSARGRGDGHRGWCGIPWSSRGEAADVGLGCHDVREFHARREARRVVRRVGLQPDVVEVQARVAPPPQSAKGGAGRILREDASRPRAVRKSRADVADLHAVDPDRMLAVRRADRIIQLDHLFDAHPLALLADYAGVVEQQVPPIVAVVGEVHVHPVVVVIQPERRPILLGGGREQIVAGRLQAGARIRPRQRRVVPAGPDPLVHVLTARRVLDVVAQVHRVVDPWAEQLVEMSAAAHAAADPWDVQGHRHGAARRHVRTERHRRAAEDVRPSTEERRQAAFIESLDEDHIRVRLDPDVSRIERGESGVRHRDGHVRRRGEMASRVARDGGQHMAAAGGSGRVPRAIPGRRDVLGADVRAVHLELHADDTDVVGGACRERHDS